MQTYKRAKTEMMENEAEERAKVERELMESRKRKMPFELVDALPSFIHSPYDNEKQEREISFGLNLLIVMTNDF